MKPLYESILRPGNIEDDVIGDVELQSILKKYRWFYESAHFEGKTLKITFDGRGYMDNFEKVATELRCKSFSVWPWAIVRDVDKLDGYELEAGTRLDIYCSDIQNCKLTAGHRLLISGDSDTSKLKIVRNQVNSAAMMIQRMNGATMTGNDFNKVTRLTITSPGKAIEKIVLGWNIVSKTNKGWSTYPQPEGKFDPDMDPIKSLGLDKHFRNLDTLTISSGMTAFEDYLQFTAPNYKYKYKRSDWGVDFCKTLTNGWQATAIKDARCI